MSEDNIAFRLKFLIQKLGITSSEFAERCGISRATLSQLLTGRNKKISDVIIGQIHSAYPSLSIMWLLFNEGDMWIGQPEGKTFQEANADSSENSEWEAEEITESPDGCSITETVGKTVFSGSQNLENATTHPSNSPEAKENGLKSGQNTPLTTENKQNTPLINNLELLNEIENLRPKPRKIIQITIYYDDNTFESFYPDSKKH
jgi:transcriptional regulator with XRE-family HTH domain